MELQDLFDALGRALNLPIEGLLPTLKDEGGEWKPDAAALVELAVKNRLKEIGTQKIGEGTRRAHKDIETFARSVGYENTDGLKGAELLTAAKAHLEASQPGGNPAEMTPEELAKLPQVRALLTEKAKVLTDQAQQAEAKLVAFQREIEGQKTLNVLRRDIVTKLAEEGAVFENAELGIKAQAREERLFRLLNIDPTRVANVGGEWVYTDADGHPETDETGLPKKVYNNARAEWGETFGFAKPGGQGAPPPPNGAPGAAGGGNPRQRQTFTDQASFEAHLKTLGADRKARAEAMEDWSEQQAKG